jgi:hypothetical protein
LLSTTLNTHELGAWSYEAMDSWRDIFALGWLILAGVVVLIVCIGLRSM